MVQTPLSSTHRTNMSTVTLGLGILHACALLLGHVLGSKATEIGPFVLTLTILSFPITFLTTDLLHEHCGPDVARRVSFFSVAAVVLSFLVIQIARLLPTSSSSHLPLGAFEHVLVAPLAHVVVVLMGYLVGQLGDISLFHWIRQRSQGRKLWMRVLVSTAAGESLNAMVLSALLLLLPGTVSVATSEPFVVRFVSLQGLARLAVVISLLPVVYALHAIIATHDARELPHPRLGS